MKRWRLVLMIVAGLLLSPTARAQELGDVLADPAFQKAFEGEPIDAKFIGAALVYLDYQRYHDAIALLEVLVRQSQHDENAQVWQVLAHAYNRTGEAERAMEAAKIALLLDPANRAAQLERGIAAVALRQPDRAVADLRDYLSPASTDAEAHYHLGMALRQRGDFPEARRHLERARELNPLMALPVTYQLAAIDRAEGRYEPAGRSLASLHAAVREVDAWWVDPLGDEAVGTLAVPLSRELAEAVHEADAAASLANLPAVEPTP